MISSETKPIFYFAYGMLTDPNIMRGVDLIGTASLPNYTLEMLMYANLVPMSGGRTVGALWSIGQALLDELDEVEGYPTLYTRKLLKVVSNGKEYDAEVYLMTSDTRTQLLDTDPSKSYVEKIKNGYSHCGIPLSQLTNAMG
jgi:gamma-glutamylcyclotransferase (GGCT)/AIG2-like uncharacterized protein YtfP